MEEGQKILLDGNRIRCRDMCLDVRTNGDFCSVPMEKETYFYRYDACDGRRPTGTAAAVHTVAAKILPGEEKTL